MLAGTAYGSQGPGTPPAGDELEARGAVIGRIAVNRDNVFDTSLPTEDNWLYRLANRWHILTREAVIRQQLLIGSGDAYSQRLVDESERLLRRNRYLYDARIEPVRVQDGIVDLRVTTRDVWTLMPGVSLSRSGGENRARLSVSESNLLGRGMRVKFAYTDDVDRESTSIEFNDNNLGDSWVSMSAYVADNSDGESRQLRIERPFYALDSRWSGGVSWLDDDAETRFYDLGNEMAEYRKKHEFVSAFGGLSAGLQDGWVRRWTAGITFDDSEFLEAAMPRLPQLLPADRRLVYPFLGVELLEDHFETTSNRDHIDRTEDFYLGTRLGARLGYAADGAGSDRDAFIVGMNASSAFGSIEKNALFLDARLDSRIEHGDAVNARLDAGARYYRKQSHKRLFFMTLSASVGHALDLDNLLQLGGDNGLRGYPLRYQVGERRLLFTIEQRYFTDWYPFRLVRVGGAVFADVGRTWGDNPAGGPPLGWLKDVGIGLRLGPTRASGHDVIHVDLAFPLDGDPSIDEVQLLLESKRSF
ncbi:MAG TPA: hypothetical protein VFE85_04835 [Woeseiaceae bacterium]|nr:hypothetical protein [Woeseiaceae bacterium]